MQARNNCVHAVYRFASEYQNTIASAIANELAKRGAGSLAYLFLKMRVELYALPIQDMRQHDFGIESRAFRAVALEIICGPRQEPAYAP